MHGASPNLLSPASSATPPFPPVLAVAKEGENSLFLLPLNAAPLFQPHHHSSRSGSSFFPPPPKRQTETAKQEEEKGWW